jgi:hypothetical protein
MIKRNGGSVAAGRSRYLKSAVSMKWEMEKLDALYDEHGNEKDELDVAEYAYDDEDGDEDDEDGDEDGDDGDAAH